MQSNPTANPNGPVSVLCTHTSGLWGLWLWVKTLGTNIAGIQMDVDPPHNFKTLVLIPLTYIPYMFVETSICGNEHTIFRLNHILPVESIFLKQLTISEK